MRRPRPTRRSSPQPGKPANIPAAGSLRARIKLYEFKKRPLTQYEDIIDRGYAYPGTTLEERLGDGRCPECGNNQWAIAPVVLGSNQGGKCYIQCIECGAHLHF
jgi:hypothetical protein